MCHLDHIKSCFLRHAITRAHNGILHDTPLAGYRFIGLSIVLLRIDQHPGVECPQVEGIFFQQGITVLQDLCVVGGRYGWTAQHISQQTIVTRGVAGQVVRLEDITEVEVSSFLGGHGGITVQIFLQQPRIVVGGGGFTDGAFDQTVIGSFEKLFILCISLRHGQDEKGKQ